MDPVWLVENVPCCVGGSRWDIMWKCLLGKVKFRAFPSTVHVLLVAPSGPEQHGWWRRWSPQLLCMVGVQWGACKSQAKAAFMSTVFAPSLDRLDWRPGWLLLTLAHRRAAAYTSAPESTPQSWGPSPWCLLLVFNLSRTKSFICPPTQHATELWSTCWCSWKGTRMRKRRSVCLTLSQWFQTPPSVTVCPEQPPSACHSTTELWALQVGCWWINGHRRAKRVDCWDWNNVDARLHEMGSRCGEI